MHPAPELVSQFLNGARSKISPRLPNIQEAGFFNELRIRLLACDSSLHANRAFDPRMVSFDEAHAASIVSHDAQMYNWTRSGRE